MANNAGSFWDDPNNQSGKTSGSSGSKPSGGSPFGSGSPYGSGSPFGSGSPYGAGSSGASPSPGAAPSGGAGAAPTSAAKGKPAAAKPKAKAFAATGPGASVSFVSLLLGIVAMLVGSSVGAANMYASATGINITKTLMSAIALWKNPIGFKFLLNVVLILFIGFLAVYLSIIYVRQFASGGEKLACFALMLAVTMLLIGYAQAGGSSSFINNYLSVFSDLQMWVVSIGMVVASLLARIAQSSSEAGVKAKFWVLMIVAIIAVMVVFYLPDGYLLTRLTH